jgi:hypothetical protein
LKNAYGYFILLIPCFFSFFFFSFFGKENPSNYGIDIGITPLYVKRVKIVEDEENDK